MQKKSENILKNHLLAIIEGEGAHINFATATKSIPIKYHGETVNTIPYSLWQLLEHMRMMQADILQYVSNPRYQEPMWPDDYWPKEAHPPHKSAWKESLKKYKKDSKKITRMLKKSSMHSLLNPIPGIKNAPTLLREILLIIDHTSYHLGQFVLLRRALGIWKD